MEQLFAIGITTALAVIGFLIKIIFGMLGKKIDAVADESSEIKSNYIAKFDETNRNINALGDKISSRFDEKIEHLTDKMEKNYVTKSFCEAIHRSE
jgi:hypothetical protein